MSDAERFDDATQADDTSSPIHVESETHLTRILEDNHVVLVDFYADWCGPCKMLAPIVEELAVETDATIAKIDTEEHPALAQQYGVRGIPTLYLFTDGDIEDRIVGLQEKSVLVEKIAAHA